MKIRNKLLVLGLTAVMAFQVTTMAQETADQAQAPAAPAVTAADASNPEAAQTAGRKIYATEDGVLSIAAPVDDDNWAVIPDDQNWFALSDGIDTITVDHYSNGEDLPGHTIAEDPFVQIYEVCYSTENEIFIVTGKVTYAEDIPYIRDSVNSFQVLQYDTKQAVTTQPDPQPAPQPDPQPAPQPVYDVTPIEATMWCTSPDGVHVRSYASLDADIIGGISYGDEVYVIGDVTFDGSDSGWLEISFGDGVGYVYEDWFAYEEPDDPEPTGDEKTIYSYDGSETREIYFYTDGIWRDDDGNTYRGGMSAEIDCSDGTVWYEWPFDPYRTGDEISLYGADGTYNREIYLYSDDQWRDDNGVIFSYFRDHEWDGMNQTILYDIPNPFDDPEPTGETMDLWREKNGELCEAYLYTDGTWRDEYGYVLTYFGNHYWYGPYEYGYYDDPSYIDPQYDEDDNDDSDNG